MKKTMISISCMLIILFTSIPSFAKVSTENLSIQSGACIIVENSTGKIIYEKNSKEKMYPASTTKIMTALLALENCKLDDVATVSKSAVKSISSDYATVYLNEGEKLTIEQLLNVLLVPSGNIVGNILAEHISGSIDGFVNLMNSRAQKLGCVNTNFANTYGLHDENHYSCAYDLYLITKEALKYDVFRSIVKQTSYTLEPTNAYTKGERKFYTTNELIKPNSSKRADNYYYAKAIGIKTGYTSQAKNCLVSAAVDNGLEFICVLLGGEKSAQGIDLRYTETKKLFNFAYNNYFLRTLREPNSVFKQIEISNGTSDTKKLDVLVKDQIVGLVDKDNLYVTIPPDATINENLKAPIKKGDVIGHITYTIDGIKYESDLIASHDVEKSYFIYIVLGIVAIVGIIFALIIKKEIRKRKRRNRKVKYRTY